MCSAARSTPHPTRTHTRHTRTRHTRMERSPRRSLSPHRRTRAPRRSPRRSSTPVGTRGAVVSVRMHAPTGAQCTGRSTPRARRWTSCTRCYWVRMGACACGSLACPNAKHASAHHGAPLFPTGEMGACGSLVCPNAKLILRTLAIVHEQRQQRQQQRQQRQQYQSHTAAAAPPPMPPPQGAAIWPALERWVDPVLLDCP